MKITQLRQLIKEEIKSMENQNLKVGDRVKIIRVGQYDREAHGFKVGDKGKITSIDIKNQRANVAPDSWDQELPGAKGFAIALSKIELV
jgi:hypothetical protein